MNPYWEQYMYVKDQDQSPYLNGAGSPSNPNGQWIIEGLK
jgi:hypothetical protein